jgi:hypothetical protein
MAAKVTGAKRIREALDKLIPQIKAPENMRKIGEQAAAMIKLRTRLGSGVATNGADKQKLKPLAKSTIEVRKGNLAFYRNAKGQSIPFTPDDNGAKVKLSDQTSPSKSNLTRTGQLLDSEGVTKVGYGTVAIGPHGPRHDSKLSNEQVAEHVTRGGRPFNNLSKVEVKRLQDGIKKQLRDLLKRVLTK